MSDQNSSLFSEAQLSQIATIMPALAAKSKLAAGRSEKTEASQIQIDGVQAAPAEDFGAQNDETKKGVLRLVDYLQREKRSKTPVKKEVKKFVLPIKELNLRQITFNISPQIQMSRALNTYDWVADYNSVIIGTCINKFF